MDYKKIIKNQEIRLKILRILRFIPDKIMISIQYRIKMGKKLNLKNPRKFTEKQQWYKVFYRNELMVQCADKYEVREYVKSKGLGNILNELYFVVENPNNINFEELPDKFVLKTTNGGGSNNVILCNKKDEKLQGDLIKEQLSKWINSEQVSLGREWVYENTPKIIAEKFIEDPTQKHLIDYKFWCFHGDPLYVFVMTERSGEQGVKKNIYDIDFNLLPYKYTDADNTDYTIKKPINYDKMVEIASVLSEDFPFVRVDLYNIQGKIIFGELTFFPGSGYLDIRPAEFDLITGDHLRLPANN